MKSVLVNIYSTSSQTEDTMADCCQGRDTQDQPVMDSGSAEQANKANSMLNDGNNCRQNKSTDPEQVTGAPGLIGNSISRSISYDYTDSTLFPTNTLTPSHGLLDENHRRNEGLPKVLSLRRENGVLVLGPDQGFCDLPSTRRGNVSTVAQGPDQAFPDLPSTRRGNLSTVAQGPDQAFPDLPSTRRGNAGIVAQDPDQAFPDLPSTRRGNAGTVVHGPAKGFPDLPSTRRGNAGTVAQGPGQGFCDLPSTRRGNIGKTGTVAQGPDQAFPELPSTRQGNLSTVAQGPGQAFPDLPSTRRGNVGTVAQGPGQGFCDLPSTRRGNMGKTGTVADGPDQAFPDLPSARRGNLSTVAQGPDQAFPDLPSTRRGNAGTAAQGPDQGFCDLPSPTQSNHIPIDISDFYYKEIFWMILNDSGSNQENAQGSQGNQSPTQDYNVAISYDATVSVWTQIYQGKKRKISNKRDTSRRIHEMFTKMLTEYISTKTFVLERLHRKIKMDKRMLVKLTEALQGLQKGDLKRIHQLIKFASLTFENIIEVVQLLLLMTQLAADAKASLIQQLKHLSAHDTDPDDSTRGTDIIPKSISTELPTSQPLLPENPLQPLLYEKCTLEPVLPGTSTLQPLLSETEDEEHDHLSQQQFPGSFPVGEKEIQQLEESAGCTDLPLQCAPSFYLIGAAQGSAFEPPQTGSIETGDVDNVEEYPHGKPAAVTDHPQRTHRIVDARISLQIQILKTEQTYTLIRYEDSALQDLIKDNVHGGSADIKKNSEKRSSDSQ